MLYGLTRQEQLWNHTATILSVLSGFVSKKALSPAEINPITVFKEKGKKKQHAEGISIAEFRDIYLAEKAARTELTNATT